MRALHCGYLWQDPSFPGDGPSVCAATWKCLSASMAPGSSPAQPCSASSTVLFSLCSAEPWGAAACLRGPRKGAVTTAQCFSASGPQILGGPQTVRFPKESAPPFEIL